MLKEHPSFVKQSIAVLDTALIFGSFVAAYFCVQPFKPLSPLFSYWPMFIGFIGFYLYFAWTRDLFSVLQFNWMSHLFTRVVMIFVSAGMLGAAILYIIPDTHNSRTLYIVFASISFIIVFYEKILVKAFFLFLRKRDKNITPVIVFGRGRMTSTLNKEILCHPEWGFRVIKTLDITSSISRFEETLKKNYVEEIFFCVPRHVTKNGFIIDPYLQVCEDMGRPARVFLNIPDSTRFANWKYHKFLERPTLISHTVELDPDQLLFKRLFDVAGSLVGLFILCLTLPFLSIIIKATSKGPVFFTQTRVGRNGRRFLIYKYRSMGIDAEELKKDLLDRNELEGAVFKMKDDPRVTRIGKFMRKFSLDELPQFINVFKGDMSLVGTRPPTIDEVTNYQKWHYRRMSIRPGITGLWQVSGRNKISNFNEIVRLDLKYIDSWSIWLDIKIIVRTIFVVFQRDAAF